MVGQDRKNTTCQWLVAMVAGPQDVEHVQVDMTAQDNKGCDIENLHLDPIINHHGMV